MMAQISGVKLKLFIIVLSIICIFIACVVATGNEENAPSIIWFKTYGQEGQDDALALILSSDGFIVGGMTESPEIDIDDSWIKRITPEGTTTTTRHYDMKIQDEARSIIEDEMGNLIMAGATEPQGESYPKDASIIKVDKAGDIIWNKTFGDPMIQEEVLDITEKQGKGYIFSGYAEDWRFGTHDALVVSLNDTGYAEWFRTYSRGTGADAQSILGTDDGYLIGGYADPSNTSNYDGWIMKIDKNGDPLWENTYGGPEIDAIHKIIEVGDGTYIATGEVVPASGEKADVWVLLFDDSGKIIWENHYGGSADDKGYHVSISPSGGYLIAGSTESYGSGLKDAWIIRLDPDGNPIWSKTIGGESNDLASSADEFLDGSIIVAGLTDSFGAGQYDAMVAKLGWNG